MGSRWVRFIKKKLRVRHMNELFFVSFSLKIVDKMIGKCEFTCDLTTFWWGIDESKKYSIWLIKKWSSHGLPRLQFMVFREQFWWFRTPGLPLNFFTAIYNTHGEHKDPNTKANDVKMVYTLFYNLACFDTLFTLRRYTLFKLRT